MLDIPLFLCYSIYQETNMTLLQRLQKQQQEAQKREPTLPQKDAAWFALVRRVSEDPRLLKDLQELNGHG
jgi:hypothetical protein